ncbi:MAG TPA: NrsF family protein [Kofleriaceae bacterium]|nr:NrsF family protein [Kofleriaceae bacterium]
MNTLRDRVLAAAAAAPSQPRAAALRQRWLVLSAATAVSLAIFVLAGGARPTGRPVELWLATSAGAIAVAVTAAALAFRRGSSMLGRPALHLVGLAVLTPLLLFAWKLGVSSLFPEMTRWWPDRAGFRCLSLSAVTGIAPIAAMLYLWRGTSPAHPRLTGMAMGTAAGALAWTLVDFWCPVAHAHHLLLGHVLPLVGFAALGAAAGGLLAARR